MATWYLSFHGTQKLEIARYEQLLSSVIGPVTIQYGEWNGNPRDFYSRSIRLTGERDDVGVEMSLVDNQRGNNDPEQFIDPTPNVTLSGSSAPFATKRAIWHAVRDALASVGYVDRTPGFATPIIDAAEAAGETAVADQLRSEVKAFLVAEPPASGVTIRSLRAPEVEQVLAAHSQPHLVSGLTLAHCTLGKSVPSLPRFTNVSSVRLEAMSSEDVDTVLAALPQPAIIQRLTVADGTLRGLPARLGELANLENLQLEGLPHDVPGLRGFRFPKLMLLRLHGIRALRREDVLGCPNLGFLSLDYGPLEELDLDIIDVCTNLHRVYVEGTPFSEDSRALDLLHRRWKRVSEIKPPRTTRPYAPPPKRAPPPAPAPTVARTEGPRNEHGEPFEPPPVTPDTPKVPSSELRPFFEALLAAPTDDTARLEMARYLTERGDERGAHIHYSVEIDELRRTREAAGRPVRSPNRRLRFDAGTLELEGGYLTVHEIRALLDGGLCRAATRFVLSYYMFRTTCSEVVEHLARSGAFPSLQELDVSPGSLTDDAVGTLAREAVGLEHLTLVTLGDIRATNPSGVSDAAVHDLARSPRLPALRTIRRVMEHRMNSGVREGDETTAIQRDDGTLVESVISHWTL